MKLTDDMQRVVLEQRLGFHATVCPDGTPNLSPKGTTSVYDDEHLFFAEIRSPRTIENLRANPAIEVNVVDPVVALREWLPVWRTARWTTACRRRRGSITGPRGRAAARSARRRAARAAFRAVTESHLRPLAGGSWILEYGFSDTAILNAQLQSLISLESYARLDDHPLAHRTVARLDVASRALLARFDTGCWSRYSLDGSDASLHYHEYHVLLLRRLAATRPHPIWSHTAERWRRISRAFAPARRAEISAADAPGSTSPRRASLRRSARP